MQNQTLAFCIVIVLIGFVSSILTPERNGRARIQSETRIKLPSDIAFTHESTGDIEGEACFNLYRKVDGICSLPMQCPEVVRDFQKGIQPQICNYKGHLPIICCPLRQPSKPVTIYPSSPSITTSTILRPNYSITTTISTTIVQLAPTLPNYDERLSEKKCKEYMKLMTEEVVVCFTSNLNEFLMVDIYENIYHLLIEFICSGYNIIINSRKSNGTEK